MPWYSNLKDIFHYRSTAKMLGNLSTLETPQRLLKLGLLLLKAWTIYSSVSRSLSEAMQTSAFNPRQAIHKLTNSKFDWRGPTHTIEGSQSHGQYKGIQHVQSKSILMYNLNPSLVKLMRHVHTGCNMKGWPKKNMLCQKCKHYVEGWGELP